MTGRVSDPFLVRPSVPASKEVLQKKDPGFSETDPDESVELESGSEVGDEVRISS